MIRLACLIVSVLIGASASAQEIGQFVIKYPLDSDTPIYGITTGLGGTAFGTPFSNGLRIETAGSSTTVSASTAGTSPFAAIGVGDVIYARNAAGTNVVLYVATVPDADTITVTTAVDLGTAGVPFQWRKFTAGTSATSGWMNLATNRSFHLRWGVVQMNAASVQMQFVCRDLTDDPQAIFIFPGASGVCNGGTNTAGFCVYTAAGAGTNTSLHVLGPYDQCRFAWKVVTDDGDDTGANEENVFAYVYTTAIER